MYQLLQDLIKKAAEQHEMSFDGKNNAVSIQQACCNVATNNSNPELARPMYLLLRYAWNDVLEWANDPQGNRAETINFARASK